MLKVTTKSLLASGSTPLMAHWWVSHALWLNIWSVVIALSLAALLISFSHPAAIRISASLVAVYGLLVWVTLQHFGHVTFASPSFLAKSPGTGLLMALTCIPLIVHRISWHQYFRIAVGLYWLIFCIFLWVPFSQFWSGQGYQTLRHVHPASLPSGLAVLFSEAASFLAAHGLFMTLALGLISLALGFTWFVKPRKLVFASTAVALIFLWVVPQGLGLGGAYAFALGSAPIIFVWALMSWFGKRVGTAS